MFFQAALPQGSVFLLEEGPNADRRRQRSASCWNGGGRREMSLSGAHPRDRRTVKKRASRRIRALESKANHSCRSLLA